MTTTCRSTMDNDGAVGTLAEIEVHVVRPRARLWDRIADVFGAGEFSPPSSSTALAILAYVSGSEKVEEGR